MPTIKEIKLQAQLERRVRKNEEFRNWQVEKFGRLLEPGDVLEMGKWDVINGGTSYAPDKYQMLVYKIIPEHWDDKLERIGLIHIEGNRPNADPDNNYCLGYGKTRLKNAVLIGKTEILATDESVW